MSLNQNRVKQSVAILLPAANEASTIEQTLLRFSRSVPQAKLVVIDNASDDATGHIAAQAIKQFQINGEVIHAPLAGKGNALNAALNRIDADIYMTCDCDLTYPIDKANDLLTPIIQGNADMVTGNRFANHAYQEQNSRPFHVFGNKLMTRFINLLFKRKYADVVTGFRAFTNEFISNYDQRARGFDFESALAIHAAKQNSKVMEIPISYVPRPAESVSKLNTYRDGLLNLSLITSSYLRFKFKR